MRTTVEKMQAILLKLSRIKNYGRKCLGIDPEIAMRMATTEEIDFLYDKIVRRK